MWAVNPHNLNRWVAYGMPFIVLGVLAFSAWVFNALICDEYLIKTRRRQGLAAVLIAIGAVLLALTVVCYIRTAITIATNPGKVPCESSNASDNEKLTSPHPDSSDTNEKSTPSTVGRSRKHNRKDKHHQGRHGREDIANGASLGEEIPLEGGENLRAVSYTSTSAPPSRQRNVSTPPPVHLAPGTPTTPRPLSTDGNQSLQTAPRSPGNLDGAHDDHHELLTIPGAEQTHAAPSEYSITRPHSMAAWLLPKNLHEFYSLDAYICEKDGLPRWCPHCLSWKPDRSHHCGELGRCIRKMDHFCPWVGGVVGETSFKFFCQMVCYGTVYCLFLLITTAIYVNERGNRYGSIPGTWLALLILEVLFGLFCAGMTSTTIEFILRNTSTIDNLSAASKIYHIAIYDPRGTERSDGPSSNASIKRITFPDEDPAHVGIGEHPRRTFVVATTEPGENPWRLESRLENFKEVMGDSVWDWFLPIRDSPCTRKTSEYGDLESGQPTFKSMYKFNPVLIDKLRQQCGISTATGTGTRI